MSADDELTIELSDVLHDLRATRDADLRSAMSINAGRILTRLSRLLDAMDYEYVIMNLELSLDAAKKLMYLYRQSLAEWREYLSDALEPLVTIGATQAQMDFAKYQTGGRILEVEEHLDPTDRQSLFAERGITPAVRHDYVRRFLAEVKDFVEQDAQWKRRHNND